MSTEVTLLSTTGQLGTGFSADSLQRGLTMNPDMIGCDAGSTDAGPYFLGAGVPKASRASVARDLGLMLAAAREGEIPMLIGSAGTGGARTHLAAVREVLLEVASSLGLRFTLGVVDSQVSREELRRARAEGRLHPLAPWSEIPDVAIEDCDPIVAQIGVEHFAAALNQGADVVLAGRATDAAIFATVPELRGLPPGPAWHAAKVLECGAASVEHRVHPDCMVARVDPTGFVVTPPNPSYRVTPQSVAAQTLYENADPFLITEPSGVLDTSKSVYEALDDRSVRVTGSVFAPKPRYDLKLEGTRLAGYRCVTIAGVRDPYVLREWDSFIDGSIRTAMAKVADSLGLESSSDYILDVRVYGSNGCLGELEAASQNHATPTELGVVFNVVAPTQESARAVSAVVWHTVLHYPISAWSGLVSNLAFPFSPPHMDAGPVYEFGINAVLEPQDPLDVGSVHLERV